MDIETERVGDYLIRVVLDEGPSSSPRDNDCNANMVLQHRYYDLPNDVDFDFDSVNSYQEMATVLHDKHDARVILPVFMLDHSGVSYSTRDFSDPWDSHQIGFIFATESQIREWHMLASDAPITPEIESIVRDGLRAEVAEYDAWARGDVYGYVIETATTAYKVEPSSDDLMGSARIVVIPPGEEVDSCWGFIGDADYCMSEARSVAESYSAHNATVTLYCDGCDDTVPGHVFHGDDEDYFVCSPARHYVGRSEEDTQSVWDAAFTASQGK